MTDQQKFLAGFEMKKMSTGFSMIKFKGGKYFFYGILANGLCCGNYMLSYISTKEYQLLNKVLQT